MRYKVGDKVRVVSASLSQPKHIVGDILTIRSISPKRAFDVYSVEENDYGWHESDFERIPQSIHITSNGKTTHAVMKDGKKIIKRSKAVCSPDDEFDLIKGALVALGRLV